MLQPEQVKTSMRHKGWSYRTAARAIGRPKSYPFICMVLNGRATSAPVLRAISALPARKNT